MAVNKPQVIATRSVDVSEGGIISFFWHSTFIISSCKFKIYSYATNSYLGMITKQDGIMQEGNYNYTCQITPADFATVSMINSQLYYAELTVEYINVQGTIAETLSSGFFVIKCLKTPSFDIVNLNPEQAISITGFPLEFTYSQEAGERLDEYNIVISDHSNTPVYNSGIISGNSILESNPDLSWTSVNIVHQIPDLSDGAYTLEIKGISGSTGISDNGIQFQTTLAPLIIKTPSLPAGFSTLALSNNKYQGQIEINSQVSVLTGTGMLYDEETADISFIDNSAIDLLQEGKYIHFDYDFSTGNDFTLCFAGKQFKEDAPVVKLANEEETIEIYYRMPTIISFNTADGKSFFNVETDNAQYAHFRIDIKGRYGQCTMLSNPISVPKDEDMIGVIVVKEGNLYSCSVEIIAG